MHSLAELKKEVALQAEKIEGILNSRMENAAADTRAQSTRTEQQLETLSGRMDEFQNPKRPLIEGL